jgi:hypothetical protein|tara:strand:- start:798 stop:971 length:174 start_codon:yes stop_codon:yes gene_type:complete
MINTLDQTLKNITNLSIAEAKIDYVVKEFETEYMNAANKHLLPVLKSALKTINNIEL